MTATHPLIYMSGSYWNIASSLSQRPSQNATERTAPSRTTSDTTAARTLPQYISSIKSQCIRTKRCCRMSRRHYRSARHEARPSKLRPLEPRATPRLPERSHIIYIPQHMRSVSCRESTTIGVHIKTMNMCNACNFREDVDASTTFPGHH